MIWLGLARHVSSGQPSGGVSVVLVFDANVLSLPRVMERGNVTCCVDVEMTGAQQFVHDAVAVHAR
jgi:hypothetical protein